MCCLARSITVSFCIESQITSQDRHSICNVNLFVDLVSMFVIDKSAIDPRLWGDWGTPKCSHWPMAIPCLLPISSRLWLVYISVYIEISISFSVQMTLERTNSLRDCHLWVRDWFAVDRRLYLSQTRLFWSTPNYVTFPKNPDPSKELLFGEPGPLLYRFKPLDWMVQWFLGLDPFHLPTKVRADATTYRHGMDGRIGPHGSQDLEKLARKQTFWLGSVPSKLLQPRKKYEYKL